MNPLPSVISQIASSVASVANSVVVPVVPDESLPTLVLISKDLSKADLAEFSNFGSVVVWKKAWKNIPFADLQQFDYLIVDMRIADARAQLAKEDQSKFMVVHFVSWVQRAEDYIAQIPGNVLCDIPSSASSKRDFDQQLLNQPLIEPSVLKSIFRFFVCAFSK